MFTFIDISAVESVPFFVNHSFFVVVVGLNKKNVLVSFDVVRLCHVFAKTIEEKC